VADFNDVLNMKPSEIEKPKPRPIGTYLGAVQKYELKDITTRNGDRKVCSFTIKLMMAQQVDDQEELAKQGDVSDWFPLTHDIFYETPEGRYGLKQFLSEVLAIDPGSGKNEKTLSEMVASSPGAQLLVTLRHEPYMSKQNTPEIATRIGGVAKV
jgi:hypothetical protein